MQYRPLGPSGIEASVIGLGTWGIGGAFGGIDDRRSIESIQTALDHGITLIDTAPVYGMGHAEEIVGRALEGRRDEAVIATKCGLVWNTDQGEHFFDRDGLAVHRFLGPDSIRWEVEQSLTRLRTDVIDLYQTHWQDATTPIEDTMAALLQLKDEGKIRAIGVSNATVEQLEQYRAGGTVDADQELFSMLDQPHAAANRAYVDDHGIAFLCYSPLALGALTGAIKPNTEFDEDDGRRHRPRFQPEVLHQIQIMLESFRPVADKYGLTDAQLVLAWTLAQPGVTHALVGARQPRHAIASAQAGDVMLSPDELRHIDQSLAHHIAEIP